MSRFRLLRLRRPDGERGVVLAWFALLLVSLMAMAAFSVDLGSWYARSAQLQRAADAGALAGVVWMPAREDLAKSLAMDAASKNLGLTLQECDSSGDPPSGQRLCISVTPAPPYRLKVSVFDSKVPAYFSRVFMNSVKQTRRATAEYTPSVPMGSPYNFFGNPSMTASDGDPFYTAVSGYCSAKEEGDRYLSRYDGQRPDNTTYQCPPTSGETNSEYDPKGYPYIISVPVGNSAITVEALDAAYTPMTNGSRDQLLAPSGAQVNTMYELWADDDNTPLDTSDDLFISRTYMGSAQAGTAGVWSTVGSIPAGSAYRRYRLQVFTGVDSNGNAAPDKWGTNIFSLRLRQGLTFTPCASIAGTPYTNLGASCPRIFAENRMSTFFNSQGGAATMYFAEVSSSYAGRKMEIQLWDPGEGAKEMRLYDPSGNRVGFTWNAYEPSSMDPATGAPSWPWSSPAASCYFGNTACASSSGSTSGSQANLALDSPNGAVLPMRVPASSTRRFNDRLVQITVDIPTPYSGGWWKLEEWTNGQGQPITDLTTWNVKIQGDPVHLVTEQ